MSEHSKICLEARKQTKDADNEKLNKWINNHELMEVEIKESKDIYWLIKRIAYIADVPFITINRKLSGNNDKWKQYRVKDWSPRLSTIKQLASILRIIIKINP